MRPGTAEEVDAAVEVWRAERASTGRRPSTTALAEAKAAIESSLFVVGDDALAAGIPSTAGDLELLTDYVVNAEAIEALADLAWEHGHRTMSAWTDDPASLEEIGFERTGKAKDNVVQLTAELEAPMREVVIGASGIRLGQLLKLAELVDTGAEAKSLLAESAVEVNGEVELRRGRQMVDGDEVRARDQAVRVRVSPR
ncbi:MAG: RNA-binding [Frankiales bacterium]|nr:RNA-binding [Frankiales bacterium]